MPGPLKVLACVDWDATTETCAAQAYVDPPTVIPTMTAAQGNEVGLHIFGAVVIVRCIVLLREAWADRIG